ncbi:helix-turn-helix domain-containing protein [Amycolatopsis sp. NPDC026612]|uniref:winged helix-turn-helix transcriptional regulator n=1 Tax=Amycolatopsis sp. NPDC026612 TaxID=3155466 RepID=UPI0033C043A9
MIDGFCQTFVSDCQVRTAIELIRHAWDSVILSALRAGPTRRNELLARIAGVSDKVLTQALQRLQAHGLVTKASSKEQPAPQAGAIYRLTPLGESLANGPLAQLAQWAADNQAELTGSSTTP